jgi:hypothetical protein
MKRLALILGLVLLLAVGVTAQEKKVAFGLKAGMDLANMSGDYLDSLASDHSMKVGFIGGGFVEVEAAPQFALQLEALYAMKGTKLTDDALPTFEGKVKTQYIEIPVLFKFLIPTQGNVKPNLFVAPTVGFLTSAKLTVSESTFGIDTTVDVKDAAKSVEFGLGFGGGISVPMESFTITFDARYTLGLTKLIKHEEWNALLDAQPGDSEYLTEDPSVKNNNISFMVGVLFK